MLKIEGMIQQPAQDTNQTQLPIVALAPEQPINPLGPLQDLCKKLNTTPDQAKRNQIIDAILPNEVFENMFNLVCAMVVQQNNPKQSKEWLECSIIHKEFDQLLMRLKECIIYNAAITEQGAVIESQCLSHHFYPPILYTLDTEVTQFYKKIVQLISVLDDAITTGQKPKYLCDARLLHDAINLQLWQNDLLGMLVNASATCIVL